MEVDILYQVQQILTSRDWISKLMEHHSVPFGFLALIGLFFAWPCRNRTESLVAWGTFTAIDWFGNILIISGSSLLVYSLQQGGAMNYTWNSIVIIATLSIAGISWLLFIGWETYLGQVKPRSVRPILPLRLVTQRPFVAALRYVCGRTT